MSAIPNDLFLYLDILGFSEMTKKHPNRVLDLFTIMDNLNVHNHHAFKSIVFSDTLIVYNTIHPQNTADTRYMVMYLIEFAQDLLYKTIGRDYYFRAIVTEGSFFYKKFNNLEGYFGEALIEAYEDEKKLTPCGLFLKSTLNEYNRIFTTAKYSEKYTYVFLTQDIDSAVFNGQGTFPFPGELLNDAGLHYATYSQLTFLHDIYKKATTHPDPRIRIKYQTTWFLYQQQYNTLCDALVKNNFDFNAISDAQWDEAEEFYQKELGSEYYKYNDDSNDQAI